MPVSGEDVGHVVKGTVKVTLKMIAEAAGTSIGTVDRALSGRPGINEATKERVQKIAKDMGYTTNKFASALSRKRAIRIGMVYPIEPQGFYVDIDRGVDQAARELAQYGINLEKLRYDHHDPLLEAELLTNLDPEKFDGLGINCAGRGIGQHIDRLMKEHHLPVITFNTDAPESARLFYVGNDSLQSGRMGAELLARYIGGAGPVTVMGNFVQSAPFTDRFGGFCEVINREYPGIALFPCAECRGESLAAETNLLSLLQNAPDMRGVFCTGHSSTVGAISALMQLDRKDIVLIGFDVGGNSLDALQDGWCDALLFQDPPKQAYQAANLLARHLQDGWLPEDPLVHVETHIVIKHNLESYRDGGGGLMI